MIELDDNTEDQYTLIFEGPCDATPETLRKIKGVCISDLEMPAEEIMKMLQNVPSTVRSASTSVELEAARDALERAGSRVLILSPSGSPVPRESPSMELQVDLGDLGFADDDYVDVRPKEHVPTYELPEISNDLGLEFDLTIKDAPPPVETEVVSPAERAPEPEAMSGLTLSDDEPSAEPESQPERKTEIEIKSTSPLSLDEEPEPVLADASPVIESSPDTKDAEPVNALTLAPEDKEIAAAPSAIVEKTAIQAIPAPSQSVPQEQSAPRPSPKEPVKAAPKPKPEAKPTPPPPPTPDPDAPPPEIQVVSIKNRVRKKLPPAVENGFYIGVGSLLLAVANYFYFTAPPAIELNEEQAQTDRALELARKKKELLKKRAEELREKAAQEQVSNETLIQAAVFEFDGYRGELLIDHRGKTPVGGKLTLSREAPLERTKEEIAQGAPVPSWVRRAEASQFQFSEEGEGFVGSAPIKFSVEAPEGSQRIVEDLRVSLKPRANDEAEVVFQIGDSTSEGLSVEQRESGPVVSLRKTVVVVPTTATP
jgi:hypothetical protein